MTSRLARAMVVFLYTQLRETTSIHIQPGMSSLLLLLFRFPLFFSFDRDRSLLDSSFLFLPTRIAFKWLSFCARDALRTRSRQENRA